MGAAHYNAGRCTAAQLTVDAALDMHRLAAGFVWLSFVDPDIDELRELAATFGLHELACADILSLHECPKFESYDDEVYLVVLRTAYYGAHDRRAHFGEVAVFLGTSFVVTARKRGPHAQGTARATLLARSDLLVHGVSAVLWAILSKVVSDIRPVVDALDADLIELEAQVFSDDDADPTRRIFDLRQQIAELYRAVQPMLGPLDAIQHGAYGRLEPMRPYLRDVGDDAKLLFEDIVRQRDRLTAVLDASLALIAHRQNQSIRKISGWAAILAVPTLIAGVFGMNFSKLPGQSWGDGFWICMALMLASAGSVYLGLKRARWM